MPCGRCATPGRDRCCGTGAKCETVQRIGRAVRGIQDPCVTNVDIALPVSDIAMAIDGPAQRLSSYGDEPSRAPLSVLLTDFLRTCFGVGLGLAAILLPAMVWRDMEALYAQFGAPVILVMFAPLAILVRTYGPRDGDD